MLFTAMHVKFALHTDTWPGHQHLQASLISTFPVSGLQGSLGLISGFDSVSSLMRLCEEAQRCPSCKETLNTSDKKRELV